MDNSKKLQEFTTKAESFCDSLEDYIVASLAKHGDKSQDCQQTGLIQKIGEVRALIVGTVVADLK